MARRSSRPSPRMWSWPMNSSRLRGRMRAASGSSWGCWNRLGATYLTAAHDTRADASAGLLHDLDEVAARVIQHRRRHVTHGGGRLGELDAQRAQPIKLGLHVIDRERGGGDAVGDERFPERADRGVAGGFEQQLRSVLVLGRDYRQPAGRADGDVELLHETELAGIEIKCFLLVINEDARYVDPHCRCLPFRPKRSVQSSQRSSSPSSGSVFRVWYLWRPSRTASTRPASSSTSRCCEIAWRVSSSSCSMIRRPVSSNSVWRSRFFSASRMVRRAGAASAWNTSAMRAQ